MNTLLKGFRSLSLKSGSITSGHDSLFKINNPLIEQHRFRGSTIQRIKGAPRPPLPFKIQPVPHKYNYIPILPKDGEYTTKALPIRKLAGRDPETGRVVVSTLGGGNKKKFRWIDYKRHAPEGQTVQEKVYKVRYDPLNTFLIALVAREGNQRWIVASENMKPGDIINTHNIIPTIPIVGNEGDTWPVGALMPGSIVHHVEIIPGEGASRCLVAGSHATVMRRLGDKVVLKMPSKQEIAVDEHCYVTCGKTSNPNHYMVNLACPQRMRWKGKRPHSGLFKKKDGYCGFKNRPPKPLQVYDINQKKEQPNLVQPIHMLTH